MALRGDLLRWVTSKGIDMTQRYKSYEDYIRPKYPHKIVIERTAKKPGDRVLSTSSKPAEIVK